MYIYIYMHVCVYIYIYIYTHYIYRVPDPDDIVWGFASNYFGESLKRFIDVQAILQLAVLPLAVLHF